METTQPLVFLLLLLIPVVLWIFLRYRHWRKKALARFGEWPLVQRLYSGSNFRQWLKLLLPLAAWMLIIIALTDIRSGNKKRMIPHAGIDLAIVLDVSNSMRATDELPDRLEVAKLFAASLINQLPDTRVAIVAFAGRPMLQTPLTIDHAAALLSLSAISTDHLPEQGSDLGAALLEAMVALPENQQHYRAMVLISDGEDFEGTVEAAIQKIRKEKIVVCTAGIGSEKGGTIPVTIDGMVREKADKQGNTIITSFQSRWLSLIAGRCNGIFVKVKGTDSEAARMILSHLDSINKNRFDEELLVPLESKFQWLLLPALILLIMDLLISGRKNKWLRI